MSITLDLFEYSSDANAQAAYVSDGVYTNDLCTGGTVLSGGDLTDQPASYAFDDTFATSWYSSQLGTGISGVAYIGYDFGSGIAYAIKRFTTTSGDQTATQITSVILQYSDNGSSWTDVQTFSIPTTLDTKTTQDVTETVTAHRYWRLLANANLAAGEAWRQREVEFMGISLQSYSESTIKTQGSYSLKAIASTSSLNKTLTRTVSPTIDLSSQTKWKFDMQSNRTGSNVKVGLRNQETDSYTKLLLHCDASPFVDVIGKTLTNNGTITLDTTTKKFGAGSAVLNGSSQYFTLADSADFYLDADFTIDLQFYYDATYQNDGAIYWQRNTGDNDYKFLFGCDATKLYFSFRDAATYYAQIDATHGMNLNAWNHLALVRYGNVYTIYVNGSSIGTATESHAMPNYTDTVYIGLRTDISTYLGGKIDELRVSKGIARWTGNFTPPTLAYGSTIETTPNITSADTFQTVEVDISGVADADKNAIDQIIITPTNADSANTVYFDNMFAEIPALGGGLFFGINF
uniref:Putative lectin/glucanase superfamily protein n=2 Tax=viral metagenome TaxID=1070528 RepID=A0A6M3KG24_9ZZZZ